MSGSHEKLPWLFWVQIILVVIVGSLYLLAPTTEKHGDAEAHGVSSEVKAAANNLKPVGNVAMKTNAVAGSSKPRSGKKVYDSACTACHTTGIANAPKPDDKAAWEPRVAQGMDGLLKTAINGKGAMPPRGGNPAVTDEELKAAIIYMTKQAGFDLGSDNQPAKKEASSQTHKTNKPKDTHSSEAPVAKEQTKAEEKSVSAPPAKPAIAKSPEPAAVAPKAPEAPEAPTVAIATAAITAVLEPTIAKPVVIAESTTATTQTASAPASKSASKEGKKLYDTMCFSCHATGVAEAPKLDDKASWATRIATGNEALYNSAIKGKGVMPPKGGNMSLTDDAIKAAVDYMVSQAQ